ARIKLSVLNDDEFLAPEITFRNPCVFFVIKNMSGFVNPKQMFLTRINLNYGFQTIDFSRFGGLAFA
ncbi:hypothetical protein, partial [Fischerella thermalis]|uniref:hypothetical protein n=1 Tax=Fischerella thermalis TaxID=372787 RepID=UPI001CA583CD